MPPPNCPVEQFETVQLVIEELEELDGDVDKFAEVAEASIPLTFPKIP